MFIHHKDPSLRKEQLRQAGRLRIPFTTGMLIGIGESHEDRLQTLTDIAAIAKEYQHIQEVILQPYSPASDKMASTHYTSETTTNNCNRTNNNTTTTTNNNDRFDISELPQLVSLARDILPDNVVIQIPPNLILSRSRDSSSGSNSNSGASSAGLELLHQCLLAGVHVILLPCIISICSHTFKSSIIRMSSLTCPPTHTLLHIPPLTQSIAC